VSSLAISIDMGRVQSSVQAAIRPAVEAALSETDIHKIIHDALFQPSPEHREDFHFYPTFLSRTETMPTLLDSLVRQSIRAIAKEYVEREIRGQRADIEEAFRKMMQGSTSRLVKAFAAATERALSEDWGFELKVAVEHKAPSDG
jgi:hypothetical protein